MSGFYLALTLVAFLIASIPTNISMVTLLKGLEKSVFNEKSMASSQAKERQIGEISAKTQSSLDMETVLRTAIQEIGKAIDAAKVQIRLGVIETAVSPSKEGEGADKT
jgi:hypothetical protein